MTKIVTVYAPVSGRSVDIAAVPDVVFAGKMVGDGAAIDPISNILVSPVEGIVTTINSAHHALCITTTEGIEILIHIGLETVSLEGKPFTLKITEGSQVKPGTVLIEFDADYIVLNAKSLLTEVIVVNMDRVLSIEPVINQMLTAVTDKLFDIILNDEDSSGFVSQNHEVALNQQVSDELLVINKTGLHARPAAVISAIAKKYDAQVVLEVNGHKANAKSIVSIMALNVKQADKVKVLAEGTDAAQVIEELVQAIHSGLGEESSEVVVAETNEQQPINMTAQSIDYKEIRTVEALAGAPGIGIGTICVFTENSAVYQEQGQDIDSEKKSLQQAIGTAQKEIKNMQQVFLAESADAAKAEIFSAHLEILQDPVLNEHAECYIAQGKSAAFAWNEAINSQIKTLAALDNELLAARANDIKDVGMRVLRILTNTQAEMIIPQNAIVLAKELAPSDLVSFDRSRLAGLATVEGSATSHLAIIAKTLGIPYVVGINDNILNMPEGTKAVINGNEGSLCLNLSHDELEVAKKEQAAAAEKYKEDLSKAHEPAMTIDGIHIEVAGNAGNSVDAHQIIEMGGEGIGLLRSEFLFLNRNAAPGEKEQTDVYAAIAKTLGKARSLIVRTLDVGGDKVLPYMDLSHEDNPFLGVRGIRVSLRYEEIFRTQLRAILYSSEFVRLKIMFPMISDLEELQQARKILAEEQKRTGFEQNVEVGVMIEVPSAALISDRLAKEVDFFSIGTNDLTQYTLAIDRGNKLLAKQADVLHPAVLSMIAMTIKNAQLHDCRVGVCGAAAADELAAIVLIGLGVTELSVPAPSIPALKAKIRTVTLASCKEIAQEVLTLSTAREVRTFLKKTIS